MLPFITLRYGQPDAQRIVHTANMVPLAAGEAFEYAFGGGGGWGDPLEREPAAVLRDVRNELLSPDKALADYGVVIDAGAWTVDAAATAKRRGEIRKARGWDTVPKVQRHDPVTLQRAAE